MQNQRRAVFGQLRTGEDERDQCVADLKPGCSGGYSAYDRFHENMKINNGLCSKLSRKQNKGEFGTQEDSEEHPGLEGLEKMHDII